MSSTAETSHAKTKTITATLPVGAGPPDLLTAPLDQRQFEADQLRAACASVAAELRSLGFVSTAMRLSAAVDKGIQARIRSLLADARHCLIEASHAGQLGSPCLGDVSLAEKFLDDLTREIASWTAAAMDAQP